MHHAEMMCRDPALVLQEKLLDLEHNPDDCMWWTHEIGSNWRTQPFREPKHSVPGWVLESYMPPGARILSFTVGSDGTNLDKLGKRHANPVNIIPGCYDAETRRKLGSTLTIAHLPHVDGTEEGQAMFAAAMNFLFDSLNHAGTHGVDMHIRLGPGPEPTKLRVYTLACQILNDHPEKCKGLRVKDSCLTNAPCCGCLTPSTLLQDILAAARYPVRDMHFRAAVEAAHGDAVLAVAMYRQLSDALGEDGAKRPKHGPSETSYAKKFVRELYDLMSVKHGGSAYDGFPWLEGGYVMLAANTDWLHVIDLGIIRRALILTAWYYEQNRGFCTVTRAGGCAELNARLAGRGGAHDGERHHVPEGLFYIKNKSGGGSKVKLKAGMQGGQIGAVASHILYATRDVRPISDFWVALCEWRDSQCANTHSFDSVLDTRKKALAYGCP